MNIEIVKFNNVGYIVPVGFEFLDRFIHNYPSFCGAGSGIGDSIVPETIGGMRIAHICHVHDESWDQCASTWLAFIKTNMMFMFNLAVYLSSADAGIWQMLWRLFKGVLYVGAVSTIGWKIFKKSKGMK